VTEPKFEFQRGNAAKLLAVPLYVLGFLLSIFVTRNRSLWVFGSGAGVAEGALAVARELQRQQPQAHIVWICASEQEAEQAHEHGFDAKHKKSFASLWATLRAGVIVVTHGLGDVNRFGIYGGTIVQLWHGAPLKRIHFDSPVTTQVNGPRLLRRLLLFMYRRGARSVSLYVAGSETSAERMRSAFDVLPGKVQALGDPRDDVLFSVVDATERRAELKEMCGAPENFHGPIIMYAPTWRDGALDPGIPQGAELSKLRSALDELDAVLIVRPHPLGAGAYEEMYGQRIRPLLADTVADPTPYLAAVDLLITDYSSIAVDFAITERPIIWFTPDAVNYMGTRGLYEPIEVTALGRVDTSWEAVLKRVKRLADLNGSEHERAVAATQKLLSRFHRYTDGRSARRVLEAIDELFTPFSELIAPEAVFFESFYGKQVACNPAALDEEIAKRYPALPRYWSVTSQATPVPEGATALLVGSRLWHAARKQAQLLIVNDWLRFHFRRRRGQHVLQTWHGTMLKHLALSRPNVGVRTRLAVHRESRRWSAMLSQNPHSSEQFRRSYAFRGEMFELGYPRDDSLAQSVIGASVHPIYARAARAKFGLPADATVITYAPTWRNSNVRPQELLDVKRLADALPDSAYVFVRGHTRVSGELISSHPRVLDVSGHPEINDVLLASSVLVTDYSSVMFDASVARIPTVFYVPDLEQYRDQERGFTFDFADAAPGPLFESAATLRETLRSHVQGDTSWLEDYSQRENSWRERFVPWDDGHASERVVDALVERGMLRV
jgi:CDP-glycerol glycerophosphotransferase